MWWRSLVLVLVLAAPSPAAAQVECPEADAERLLQDSQASFVGVFLGQVGDEASFLVQEVVTGPVEEGAITVTVVGEPYDGSFDDAAGYFVNRVGGAWVGDGCHVVDADALRAVGPGGDGLAGTDGEPEAPPFSLFLIGLGIVVVSVYVARYAARRRSTDD